MAKAIMRVSLAEGEEQLQEGKMVYPVTAWGKPPHPGLERGLVGISREARSVRLRRVEHMCRHGTGGSEYGPGAVRKKESIRERGCCGSWAEEEGNGT